MHPALSAAAKRMMLSTGHYARVLSGASFGGVVVLCYHNLRPRGVPADRLPFGALHLSADEFDDHCALIRETCHPISIEQWRRSRNGGPPLPERPILVTFDDGYRSVATIARPILEKHGVPAVVFVCTGPVADGTLFWFDAAARRDDERVVEGLKAAPWSDWQPYVNASRARAAKDDLAAPLTVDELKALAESPLVEVGAHTHSHPILARAPAADQTREIERSKRDLESWTGRRVTAFAYPNGRTGLDYTAETVAAVEHLGFDLAFTTESRVATAADCALELPRFLAMTSVTTPELAHRLAYSWFR